MNISIGFQYTCSRLKRLSKAIIFSVENKHNKTIHADGSSTYEKMAIALSASIRDQMPDVDIYCGCFTNNKLSDFAKRYFEKYKVNVVEDLIFDNVTTPLTAMFLRSFTKHYFATKLLEKYDYLIYTDVDVLFLKPLDFKFDPTSNIVVVDAMPEWVKNYQRQYTVIPEGNVYYNWIDVINRHNAYIYDIDYFGDALIDHSTDIIITRRIDNSSLTVIDQDFGGYHCFKLVTPESLVYHYDDLGTEGSLINLQTTHPAIYTKYKFLFENVLKIKVSTKTGFWENVKDQFS